MKERKEDFDFVVDFRERREKRNKSLLCTISCTSVFFAVHVVRTRKFEDSFVRVVELWNR